MSIEGATAGTLRRLKTQQQQILELLQGQAIVSNGELARISLKYFTKISNLRTLGWRIRKVEENEETGEAWYSLEGSSPKLDAYDVRLAITVQGTPLQELTIPVEAVSALSAKYRAQHGQIGIRVLNVSAQA